MDGYKPTENLRWEKGVLRQRFVSCFKGEDDEWRDVPVYKELNNKEGE